MTAQELAMQLELTESGFLANPLDWDEVVAEHLAQRCGIRLTAAHWEVVYFIRSYYALYQHLPNARMFVKAIKKAFGPGKGNSLYLQQLFPDGPVRLVCLIAGLQKPPGCL